MLAVSNGSFHGAQAPLSLRHRITRLPLPRMILPRRNSRRSLRRALPRKLRLRSPTRRRRRLRPMRTSVTTNWISKTTKTMRTSSSLPRKKPPARWRRSMRSSSRYLKNYKKMLTFVSIGVIVETLFNVIMPLSLKFLIDDALGEEDFQALYMILGVLAASGHRHLDRRGLVRALGRQARGRAYCGCAVAPVRARPEFAGGLFCAHQTRRNPVAIFHRSVGLRRIDQEFCEQRSACRSLN